MHLVDSSVWVALAIKDHVHHRPASDWLDTIDEPSSVLFCRATQLSFLRLATTASIFARYGDPPASNQEAWRAYEAFLADDRITFQDREPAGLDTHWKAFTHRNTASPKLWMDAYLAAFAQAGGYQLVTTDSAFMQFRGLDVLVLGE